MVAESTRSNTQHISTSKAALQLALSHRIGFGTPRNDSLATQLLNRYSLGDADLQSCVQSVKDGIKTSSPDNTLYERLYSQHRIRRIDLSEYYREKGLLEKAEVVYKREIDDLHRVFGRNHEIPLILMFWLARILVTQERWEEAVELETQVMETEKEWFGRDNSNLVRSLTHLAKLKFEIKGKRSEAEKLALEAIDMGSRVMGPENPDTLVGIGLLALMYRRQGRLDEAEELETRVMDAYMSALGAEHPDTLISQSNIAAIFRGQGRYEESEQLYMQIIETSKRVIGREHPETLQNMRDLASTYNASGKWEQAEQLGLQALQALRRVLGPEHRDALTCQSNLAVTYFRQGRLEEAEEKNFQVWEISKKLLGPYHPDTLISQSNMISIYKKQGRMEAVKKLQITKTEAKKAGINDVTPNNGISKRWKARLQSWRLKFREN